MSLMKIGIGFSLFCAAVFARSCIWDYDTLEIEARGMPGVLDAIMGNIVTLPKEYYTRRVEIATIALKANPSDLAQYDNLAMAHDKLGHHIKSKEVLGEKYKLMKRLNLKPTDHPTDDPWYRYHANLGTAYVHEWLAKKEFTEFELLDKGILELDAAIRINPKAHFGRETIQVEILRLIRAHPETLTTGITERAATRWSALTKQYGVQKTIDGIVGMMTFGGGPDSPLLVQLLYHTLDYRSAFLKTIAHWRICELTGSEDAKDKDMHESMIQDDQLARLRKQYLVLRTEVDTHRASYQAKVRAKLGQGLHPDTHGNAFWESIDLKKLPDLSLEAEKSVPKVGSERDAKARATMQATGALLTGTLVATTGTWYLLRRKRIRRTR